MAMHAHLIFLEVRERDYLSKGIWPHYHEVLGPVLNRDSGKKQKTKKLLPVSVLLSSPFLSLRNAVK